MSLSTAAEHDAEKADPSPAHTLTRHETGELEEELEITGIPEPPDWEEDPDNPHNWPTGRKWAMASIVAFYTLVSPMASAMLAPGLPEMAMHFKTTDPSLVSMILCIFVLGFAFGPLLFAPLSEMYGRTWVLHLSTVFFLIMNLACVWAPNLTAILMFRFLGGVGGSAGLAIGGGCIADLFRPHERAGAMGMYSLGPLIGPIVGPVAGGFIVDGIGFKWIFVIVSAMAGLSLIVGLPLLRETYAPVIIERRALRRAKEAEAAGQPPAKVPKPPPLGQVLWINLTRPFILLTRSLTCFMLSFYTALIYGYLFLMLTTFPFMYSQVYGWGPGIVGLAYLGLGVGNVLGAGVGAQVIDKIYHALIARNDGKVVPEFRVPGMIIASLFVPVGLFWYGWSAHYAIHWIMPIIGTTIFGIGLMLAFLAIQLYLVDTFKYAASVIAANSFLRSIFGFAFPLFARQMFDTLKTGPGNSLLGGVAILFGIPFPIYLYYRGAQVRARDQYTRR
ncbi:MFS general substrate transporter [Auricularia subglabra TFB-10046 SS5]|nr:MFS general substrate transporter [Auricularia subglabra TFB-10046 SS5]